MTRDDMNRVTRCPPIDQMSMRYVQIDPLNLVRGHSDIGQFPDFPDLRLYPDSPNLPPIGQKTALFGDFCEKIYTKLDIILKYGERIAFSIKKVYKNYWNMSKICVFFMSCQFLANFTL